MKNTQGVVFVYSGIGTQWESMAAELTGAYPVFADAVREFDEAFTAFSGWSVRAVLEGRDTTHALASAAVGHPCIVAVEIGLTRLLASWGLTPAAVLGHSGGEVAASVAAGMLSVADAARVANAHSNVLVRTAGQGAMAHIGLAAGALATYLTPESGLEIAAMNSPAATVISGTRAAVEAAVKQIEADTGAFCRVLRTDVPFHTAMLEDQLSAFGEDLRGIAAQAATLPVFSSLLGRGMTAGETTDVAYWQNHIRRPVAFCAAAQSVLAEGYARFVEVSAHAVLLDALAESAKPLQPLANALTMVGTLSRKEPALPLLSRALTKLAEAGVAVDWSKTGLTPEATLTLTVEALKIAQAPVQRRAGAMAALIQELLREVSEGTIEVCEGLAFREMGVTSLMALRLTRALEKRLGLPLSAALLFNYPDVPALAGFLLGRISPDSDDTQAVAATMAESREPLAIVGIACRLPGGADTPAGLWKILEEGRDVVCDVPPARWDINQYYDPDPAVPGKMHTREGGFLQGPVDSFDARFFNISTREALQLDPQQRLLLEVVWEAFESGGIPVASLRGTRTGVFLGISSLDYTHAHRDSYHRDRIDAYSLTGTTFSAASGRISYVFGFEGPCFAVDTACSSSMVALHCASRSLRSGESEVAIVTGVNLMLIPDLHICFTKLGATSADGRSKTFDDGANGYGRGEGAVALVLKRLSDAERDRNRIFGLLRGTAVNQDGRSNGLTAPNGLAQQRVVAQALADAGLKPEEVSYVEAHGTGTALGDSIELEALGAAYCKNRARTNPLMVGSVKANIGHLEPAAGLAGAVKLMTCLQHRKIPANIHIKTPNTRFDWQSIPLVAPTALTEWNSNGSPRLAGLSAFGFSGTNGHAIFEEAPEAVRPSQKLPSRFVLPLSARSESALRELRARYASLLPGMTAEQVADVCYTASAGRTHFEWRSVVVGATAAELVSALSGADAALAAGSTRLAMLFTGQGSQYAGMGREAYEQWPIFRQTIEECAEILRGEGLDLHALLYGAEDAEALARTDRAQPLIASIEVALYRQWLAWGVKPAVLIGHSVGEYPAAVAAGIMTLPQMLRLVALRGRLMQESGAAVQSGDFAAGGMAAAQGSVDAVRKVLAGISGVVLAADNSPQSVTISGGAQALEKAVAALQAAGMTCKTLQVGGAFHSPAMATAREQFLAQLRKESFEEPAGPQQLSTSEPGADGARLRSPEYWADQIVRPVLFRPALESAGETCGAFLEIGATTALSALAGQTLAQAKIVSSLHPKKSNAQTLLEAAGALFAAGVTPDFEALYAPFGCLRVTLPTYPFERQPFWMEVVVNPPSGAAVDAVPGRRLDSPAFGNAAVFETVFDDNGPAFLHEHIIYGQAISPAAGHIAMMLATARALWQSAACEMTDLEFLQPLLVLKGQPRLVQVIVDDASGADSPFRLSSRPQEGGEWLTHCTGRITRGVGAAPAPEVVPGAAGVRTRFPESFAKKDFYADFIGAGYELGDGFLRIEEINLGDTEAFCRVQTRRGTPAERGHVLYPGAVDSILQTMLPSFLHTYMKEMLSDGSTLIPMHMDRVRFFADAGADVWCHSHTRREDAGLMRGEILALNASGAPVMAMDGVLMRKTTREVLYRQLSADLNQMLYAPAFLPADATPDAHAAAGAVATGAPLVLSATSSPLAEQIASALGGNLTLAATPAAIAAAAGSFGASGGADGAPALAVYLAAQGEDSADAEIAECERLITLAKTLSGRPVLLRVITSGAAVCGEEKADYSIKTRPVCGASLWGAGRTIGAEAPELWGGVIDLPLSSAGSPADGLALALLVRLAKSAEKHQLVAIRGGKRLDLVLQKLSAKTTGAAPLFACDRSYLITGGFGALGLRTAQWMAENGAGHLVLTGRSDRSKDCAAALQDIRAAGGTITVIPSDIGSEADVRRMIGQIRDTLPPLDGIFHAAGLLEDAMLPDMSRERLERVMSPKVRGTLLLEAATNDLPLRYFVLYSSAATILGSQGQANYSAANQFMNAVAARRQAMGKAGLSVCWGPWDEAGMAAGDAKRGARLAGQGILGLSTRAAFEGMKALLGAGTAVGCVMPMDWKRFAQASGVGGQRYFSAVIRKEWLAAESGAQGDRFVDRLQKAETAERLPMLQIWLQELGQEVLGFAGRDQVLPDQPLMEQGLDSLMAVDIRNRLNRELEQVLPAAVLFNYPTIRALSGYLLSLIDPQDVAAEAPAAGEKALVANRLNGDKVDDLLDEIDDLLK